MNDDRAFAYNRSTLYFCLYIMYVAFVPTPQCRVLSVVHVHVCVCKTMQGAQSDSEEESVTSDLKDLEFKLLHDLSQLQVI